MPTPTRYGRLYAVIAFVAATSVVGLGVFVAAASSLSRQKSARNLYQIALAIDLHNQSYQYLPGAAICDKKTGQPLLSWRVAMLPWVQGDLFHRFKLDEPWDGEHNKALIPLMPKVYADPRTDPPQGMTIYKAFTGPHTVFPTDPKARLNLRSIKDATADTLLVVAAGDPVVWTKPEDIRFDPDGPLPDLSRPSPDVLAAFCDNSVRILPAADEKTLKALITANGGEVVTFNGTPAPGLPMRLPQPAK